MNAELTADIGRWMYRSEARNVVSVHDVPVIVARELRRQARCLHERFLAEGHDVQVYAEMLRTMNGLYKRANEIDPDALELHAETKDAKG